MEQNRYVVGDRRKGCCAKNMVISIEASRQEEGLLPLVSRTSSIGAKRIVELTNWWAFSFSHLVNEAYNDAMGHIIPVINAVSFAEIKEKIKRLEPHAEGPDNGGIKWVHIDVADGSFTENVLWHNPKELPDIKTPLFLELHLMLDHIDEKISDWLLPNVRRNIVHVEAAQNLASVIQLCHQADIEAGVALKPETPCAAVSPYFEEADLVQILAVEPGRSGQTFRDDMIPKIAELRRMCQSCVIEVDGGVNAGVVKRTSAAGANLFAAGHELFIASDIKKAIDDLERNAQA